MRGRIVRLGALIAALLALTGTGATAASLTNTNLVDLLRDANAIVVGEVRDVTDGIDAQGLPYTEVTLAISETMKGSVASTYTFRQFGLMAPRPAGDGRVMMPAPAGFPRYAPGEQVVLFLYTPAALTGLQTTVALGQGRFVLGAGRAENDLANNGVFQNVSVDAGLTDENQNRVLATEIGAVSAEPFLSLVRRAVQDRWVETCQMWKTDLGKTCGGKTPKAPVKPGSSLAASTSSNGL
jgi:hypothetical protein